MISIQERNRKILQMRREGISQREVARKFQLSPSRIYLLERRAAADQAMAERRAKLRAEIRAADDPEKMWPVTDLADAIGPIVVTKKRLLDHF
jgi:transposase